MSRSLSLYEVLGVEASASAEELRAAYRRAARAVHPDRAEGADRFFLMVQEAYEVLGDPDRRRRYDQDLSRAQAAPAAGADARGPEPASPSEPTPSAAPRPTQPGTAETPQEHPGRPGGPSRAPTVLLAAFWATLSAFLVFEFATIGRGALVIAAAYVAIAAAKLWTGRGRLDLLVRASWALAGAWALIAAISWAMGRSMLVAGLLAVALAGWATTTQVLARQHVRQQP